MTQPTTQPMTQPMTRPPWHTPFDVPAATHSYLARAASSLQEAMTTSEIPMRYACAHVAALRTTAALLAARATPTLVAQRNSQRNSQQNVQRYGRGTGQGQGTGTGTGIGTGRGGRRTQKNAWVLLAEIAPEFAEWASFFAAGAAKRAAAESGSRRAVTEREADDLVRDADLFLGLVEESLGMTRHVPGCFHVA